MTLCSSWITETDLIACGCPDSTDPTILELAMESASEILYRLTAQQYPGTCTERLRPCASPGNPLGFPWLSWHYPWVPLRIGGQWINMGPCGCHTANDCACAPYPKLDTGRADVQSIQEVSIAGVVLADSAYRLDSNRYLVRTDGSGWPCCQNLARDVDEAGTWYVDLTYGWPVPTDLQRAAAVLATEFVKACTNDATCRFPQRTQTITRQGVTIGFLDPFDFLNSGRTGLFEVDLAVVAHNPHNLTRPSGVWSPELRGRGVRSVTP